MAVRFNINNPDSCQRAYLNYHCYGNTMNISPADMGAIISRWGDKVESWEKTATTNDQIDYEFDNSDFEKYKNEGYNNAKTQHGDGINIGGEHARGTADAAFAGASLFVGPSKATITAAKKVAEDTAKGEGKTALGRAWDRAGKVRDAQKEAEGFNWGVIASCAMVLATGLAYTLKKPNEDEMNAVKKLNEEMGTAQANLMTQQEEMADTQAEIVTKVGEAETANEEANAFIAEEEATQQFIINTINSIKAKQESGVQLTASERALYNESVKLLNESNVAQSSTGTETQDEVAGIYSEIEGYQGTYDNAAQTIGNIQGLTSYAESIDNATAWSCGIEAAAQGINVASAFTNAKKAIQMASCSGWFGIAYGIAAAGAAAGGVMSGIGVYEQGKGLSDAMKEIDSRKNTQGLNTSTQEIYTQEIDAFAGSLGYIEELDYEIPDLDDTSDMILAPDKPVEEPVVKKKTEEK